MFVGKKIGVWGLERVGRAAIEFLIQQEHGGLYVMDMQEPTDASKNFFDQHGIIFLDQKQSLNLFLDVCDLIIPSPGIDLRPYTTFCYKWLVEVDIFEHFWQKPIVAITGSLGKTSVTKLLAEELQLQGLKVGLGGNIGTGMLSLIKEQDNYDIAVLELSSFQLEYAQNFAPDLAVITNIYPNHLDRHGDMAAYSAAKKNIFLRQQQGQFLLLHDELESLVDRNSYKGRLFLFGKQFVQRHDEIFYFIGAQGFIKSESNREQLILPENEIPTVSFKINWLIVAAALDMMNFRVKPLMDDNFKELAHRLEPVPNARGIEVYNDSKATVMESTLSAVHALQGKSITLMLGGLSKGVVRKPAIQKLASSVSRIVCFGSEADELQQYCRQSGIGVDAFVTLDDAVKYVCASSKPGQVILFSPGGSSYDLYKNYEERGNAFKQLISSLDEK